LTEFEERKIPYHLNEDNVKVNVPPAENMAAVKLGLPVDYKNNLNFNTFYKTIPVIEIVV